MPALTAATPVTFAELLGDVRQYKYNPTAIQRVILEQLEAIVDGSVELVDPTSPFIFLLEASAVNTAAAIAENELSVRRLYPKLAQTEDDLYVHLSDVDYLNRFASPTTLTLKWLVDLNDLMNRQLDDGTGRAFQVVMPRETTVTVNGLQFMHQYPIIIKRYSSGVIEVSYDAEIASPLQLLNTNIIPTVIKTDANGSQWLYFETDAVQMSVVSSEYPLQSSQYFQESIQYSGQYYYARVYRSTVTGWEEITTTHTDQVFDPFVPTVVLRVVQPQVTLSIPPIYLNNGALDGKLRVDVYTTLGSLTVDMRNFKIGGFSTVFRAIDEKRDITQYTNAMLGSNYIVYADSLVSGGSNALTFETLRERVLNNTTGPNTLPVTDVQLGAYAQRLGFDMVSHIDHITNRVFLATRNLPTPSDTALVTQAQLTVCTLITSMDMLSTYDHIHNNGVRMTVPSKSVYQLTDGQLFLLTHDEVTAIKSLPPALLADRITRHTYLYSPFYYVLDNTSRRFEIRAYDLDTVLAESLSFTAQNPTLALQVSTKMYQLTKTETGYRLTISTLSDNFYKKLDDRYVQVQLAYIPPGESRYAYMNGTLLTRLEDNERVYTFDITTEHDIDVRDRLYLTGFDMFIQDRLPLPVELTQSFTIFYTTQSIPLDYVKSSLDDKIAKFLLPDGAVAITQEALTLSFGVRLKHLWTQSRSVSTGGIYKTYTVDIPLTYKEDVYKRDPITHAIFTVTEDSELVYERLHRKGDPVYDSDDNPVYLYRKGDVVLDDEQRPIEITGHYAAHHLDLLLVDGMYYFATDAHYVSYRKEIRSTLRGWIIETLNKLSEVLLEQTRVYYHPKNGIGPIDVKLDADTVVKIAAQQAFTLVLFVNSAIYHDEYIRNQLKATSVRVLDYYIQRKIVSMSDITAALKTAYGESVRSFSINGLGGSANYPTVTVVNSKEQLTLLKRLVAQDDDTLVVQEAVTIDFVNYEL